MDAELPTPSHKALWRKLRRRYLFYRPFLLTWFFVLVPAASTVAWMLRDAGLGWLVYLTGFLWLLINIGSLLPVPLLFLVGRSKANRRPMPPMPSAYYIYLLSCGFTMIALLAGRMDVAIYINYGFGTLSHIVWEHKVTLANMGTFLINVILLMAFAAGSIWMVILMLMFWFAWQFRKRPLMEVLRKKPSRAEYVARTRESCAAGGG